MLGPAFYLGGVQDLANLGRVNIALSRLCLDKVFLKKLIRRNLELVLRLYGVNYQGFSTMLSRSKSVLSGSTVLQCVSGDLFLMQDLKLSCTDLDIYVPYDMTDYVMDFFVRECGYEVYSSNLSVYVPLVDGVYQVNHETKGRRLDLVIMRPHIPPKAAIAQFDFSFLMSLFDGMSFHMWFPGDIISKSGFCNEVLLLLSF